MARHKFSELRQELEARPGAKQRLGGEASRDTGGDPPLRATPRRGGDPGRVGGPAGRDPGAVSKFEHADDVRVSTLRQYLDALGAGWSWWPCSTTRTGECPCTWVDPLPDLLPDRSGRTRTEPPEPGRRSSERPAHRHEPAPISTERQALRVTHSQFRCESTAHIRPQPFRY